MIKSSFASRLPVLALGFGAVGFLLRRLLFRFAVDGKGLLIADHPISAALWVLTALAVFGFAALSLKSGGAYERNFTPSPLLAAFGHILLAAGILATVIPSQSLLGGRLGLFWKWSGIVSGPCLFWAAFDRIREKKPFFLLHVIPCLFLVFHIVDHYRLWSSQPQLQLSFYPMLGSMSLMFFIYYIAAFEVDMPRRKLQIFMGLSAIYLCMTGLVAGSEQWLYIGGVCFTAANFYPFVPKDQPPQPKQEGEGL